MKINYKIYWTW